MGQPLNADQAAMLAHAEQTEQMALMLDGTLAFDPSVFQGMMTTALGPIGAPFTAAFMAAITNQHINAHEAAAALHAHAQATRESALHYETTDDLNAAALAADKNLADELGDQLDSAKKEADKFEQFKQSPEPPSRMPPPPPDPRLPDDIAAYNSENKPWDKAAAAANKAEAEGVREYFRSKGWNLSDSMLGHYLQNTGEGVVLPESAMKTIVSDPQIVPALDKQMSAVVGEAVANARNDPSLYRVPQAVSTPYNSGVIARDNDITNADGHFSVATSALVTVNPPDENGQITYSAESQTHMYDYYYYFHQTEEAQWDPVHAAKQSVDDDMRMLESEGWAKSFRVHGSGPTNTTTGAYDG